METGEAPNPPFIITYRSAITTHVSHSIPLFCFQVLVAQIGNVLGLKDVDSGIDDFRSTNSLSFDQFRFYLCKEVSTFTALHKRYFFQLFPRFSALKTVSLECGFFAPSLVFHLLSIWRGKWASATRYLQARGRGTKLSGSRHFRRGYCLLRPITGAPPCRHKKRGRGGG